MLEYTFKRSFLSDYCTCGHFAYRFSFSFVHFSDFYVKKIMKFLEARCTVLNLKKEVPKVS